MWRQRQVFLRGLPGEQNENLCNKFKTGVIGRGWRLRSFRCLWKNARFLWCDTENGRVFVDHVNTGNSFFNFPQRGSRLVAVYCRSALLHVPAEGGGRTRARSHDRPEPPDRGGAGGHHDGAEEGRRAEEGRGRQSQVEKPGRQRATPSVPARLISVSLFP